MHAVLVVTVGEDAAARFGREENAIFQPFGALPKAFVVRIEQQLVLHDRPRQRPAELVQIEKRLGKSGLIAEPFIGGELRVAVVQIGVAVKVVGSRRGAEVHLRRPAADGRASVLGGDRELADLVDEHAVGNESKINGT